MEEINSVMSFITTLLQDKNHEIDESDIGVVSPYKLQCKIIRQKCDKNEFHNITIGTAEVFQGQERKVMIVSTVRAGKRGVGDFLSNPQVSSPCVLLICQK